MRLTTSRAALTTGRRLWLIPQLSTAPTRRRRGLVLWLGRRGTRRPQSRDLLLHLMVLVLDAACEPGDSLIVPRSGRLPALVAVAGASAFNKLAGTCTAPEACGMVIRATAQQVAKRMPLEAPYV